MSELKEKTFQISPEWIEKHIKLNGKPFKLYPYQVKFIMDKSDKKIVLKARQTGFSTIVALEALLKCLRPNRTILIVSISERQSQEIINKVKNFLTEGVRLAIENQLLFQIVTESKKELSFKNGSRLISLPNSPEAARGYPADDVYLDETAHLEQDEQMFTSIRPTLSRGGRLTLVSTPAGKVGKFYEMWQNADELGFSKHKVHWNECPDENYLREIESFKSTMDEFSFAQEYELEFLSEGMGFFPPNLVMPCVDKVSSEPADERNFIQFGMDVGKSKSNTALVVAEKVEEIIEGKPKIKVYIRKIVLWRLGTDYDLIKSDLKRFMNNYKASRVNIDSTGIGERYVEEIRKEEGSVIIPIKFSNPMKERMFSQLRTLFENGQIVIPQDKVLLNQLFQFERTITKLGNVQYSGKKDDIVMALALSTLDLTRPRPFFGVR